MVHSLTLSVAVIPLSRWNLRYTLNSPASFNGSENSCVSDGGNSLSTPSASIVSVCVCCPSLNATTAGSLPASGLRVTKVSRGTRGAYLTNAPLLPASDWRKLSDAKVLAFALHRVGVAVARLVPGADDEVEVLISTERRCCEGGGAGRRGVGRS